MDNIHFWAELILFLFVVVLTVICSILSKHHQEQHRDIIWYRENREHLSQLLRDKQNECRALKQKLSKIHEESAEGQDAK